MDAALDPRILPGAYITDGNRLMEVAGSDGEEVCAHDCKDDAEWLISLEELIVNWQLVKSAPAVPDTPESTP